MWILQAFRNPVSKCFSSDHRTGVKAKSWPYYWSQITSIPRAQLNNVGSSLLLGCWWEMCVFMGPSLCCMGLLFPALGTAGYEPSVDPQTAVAGVWGHQLGLEAVAPGFVLRALGSQHSNVRWELPAYRVKLGKTVPKITVHRLLWQKSLLHHQC